MIINLKQNQQPKRLTFGDVPVNALFVSLDGYLRQKQSLTRANIICKHDGMLYASSGTWTDNDEIREILPITGFDYREVNYERTNF
jgi:hypothetical protein